MSANPGSLSVTYISAPPSTTSVATIPIPQILQTMNSTQTVEGQTGFNSIDVLLDGIFRRKYFYVGTSAIPTSAIVSITWS
jgi:hypothetical protein